PGAPAMTEANSFGALLLRVRAGDGDAAAELMRRYEPAIRVFVRSRLTDPRLRRYLDSVDICQSVFFSFFVRAAAGQYELEQEAQLKKLLGVMALNKLLKHAEKQRAQRRDCRRVEPGALNEGDLAAPGPSPSSVVSHNELLSEFRRRLTP